MKNKTLRKYSNTKNLRTLDQLIEEIKTSNYRMWQFIEGLISDEEYARLFVQDKYRLNQTRKRGKL